MNSRERVLAALNHRQPDCVPLDIGGSPTSGMQVSSVYLLRQALHLDPPGTPVKVTEPYQMLGEIQPDLIEALGIDVVPLPGPRTMFGFANDHWKPWTLFDGTPVLVPEAFNTIPEPNGDILMYPEGDRSVPPSGRMPAGGFYFDAIIRQPPIDENRLDPADNLEEFEPISDSDLAYFASEAERLYSTTDKAILANFGGTAFGDIALVPVVSMKHPRGIRDVAEWYISTVSRRDYVWKVFEKQCEIGLANLEKLHQVVGEKVAAVFVTGTDFGAQNNSFISPRAYRQLYQPFHNPRELKGRFGDRLVFWGGGIDTQQTLPFGTPAEIQAQVRERMQVFGPGGGFVFNPIHNVQARTPAENLLALYQSVREYREYPL
jgi:hypothetical protein